MGGMRRFQLAPLLLLATIGGTEGNCPPASGSSIGLAEWLKDENSTFLILPSPLEPAPVHVPHLSMLALMQPIWGLPETIQPPPGVTSVSPAQGNSNGPLSSPLSVPAPPSIVLLLLGMGIVVRRLRIAANHKSSRRTRRGGFIVADEKPPEGEPSNYPSPKESMDRLQRSGWHLGVSVLTNSSGETVWQVTGNRAENRIEVQGASRGEACHHAVEAVAACEMLADRPPPPSG
jgi:hypothetical protein